MLYPATCFLVLSILSLVNPSVQDCRVIADCNGGTGQCRAIIQQRTPGPKGEPGCGCDTTKEGTGEPKLYFASNTIPYAAAEPFCQSFGRTLCKFDDICKPENGGRKLIAEVIPGDHWVPIADEFNDWVEIGDTYVNSCFRHREGLSREADWGLNSDSLDYRGYVFCCPASSPAIPDKGMIYDYIGQGATYGSSQAHCESQNMRLCNASEVCQDFVPKYGKLSTDMWIAIQDIYNDWIQIGSGHTPCLQHIAAYGPPTWGVRNDESTLDFVGYDYCCPGGATPAIPGMIYENIGETATYESSQADCKSKNMRLCYADEICQDSVLKYGRFSSDRWSAIQDRYNDWIQTGSGHAACLEHVAAYGAPMWGVRTDGSPVPALGYNYCCPEGARPAIPGMIYDYIGETATYESSQADCKSKNMRLCYTDEICQDSVLKYGRFSPDRWSAIQDRYNDWIQTGSGHAACLEHVAAYGAPMWGVRTDGSPVAALGYNYCCPEGARPAIPGMIYDYIGETATYESSQADCKSKNMRLCYADEICQDSVLKYGRFSKDRWSAIQDRYNDWIQTGNGHAACLQHVAAYGAPTWGVRTDGSIIPALGYNYCCPEGETR